MAAQEVSIVIPTMPGREEMLKKLLSTIPSSYQIIVVNNPDLLLAGKRNLGAHLAVGKYILFIDDDNYLKDFAIENMLIGFSDNIGVMGMTACYSTKKMLIADGGSLRYYTSGFMKGVRTNERFWEVDQEIYAVDEVANAFMIPRALFVEVGGFDEVNFPIDLDEADICKRIMDMGYLITMNPKAICYHNSVTYSAIPDFRRPMNAFFMGRNKILYQRKHLSKPQLLIYFLIFFPITVLGYLACLLYRGKPAMCFHFLKGILHGLQDSRSNPYQ